MKPSNTSVCSLPSPCQGEGMGLLMPLLVMLALTAWAHADDTRPVTLDALVAELADRASIARWPSPAYTQGQSSSYDRASVDARDPATWFANHDRGHYPRIEERDGRREHVMLDVDGPGVVTRLWSANPAGTLRVYLDGASEPVIVEPMADWMAGRGWLKEPWAGVRSQGHNVYLPIPFARGCKITSDAGDFYYIVNYRRYEPGTAVASLTARDVAAMRGGLVPSGEAMSPVERVDDPVALPFGSGAVQDFKGPGVIRRIDAAVASPNMDPEWLRATLRRVMIELTFDGKVTARVPVGDFFGSGIGLNPHADRYRSVGRGGWMRSAFAMPFARSARVRLLTADGRPAPMWLRVQADTGGDIGRNIPPRRDGEPMLYFHADWRQQRGVPTRPMHDMTFLDARGRGVLVGDQLTIVNPVPAWWGEGDEKIYVDADFTAGPEGTAFPSHFGTGTEDYYGYAWCSPVPFQHPLHAQVQCQGFDHGTNYGVATVARMRGLDAIPFDERMRFDMELWHWQDTTVDWATTTFYYATADTRTDTDHAAARREAAAPPPTAPPLPEPLAVEGAIEMELTEHIAATSPGLVVVPQGGFGPDTWSRGRQLWVQAQRPGEWIELAIEAGDGAGGADTGVDVDVEATGPRRLIVRLTKSWDYAVVSVAVNGRVVEPALDTYNHDARAVEGFDVDLGVHRPIDGRWVVRFEVVGKNDHSEGTAHFFGIDYLRLVPPD